MDYYKIYFKNPGIYNAKLQGKGKYLSYINKTYHQYNGIKKFYKPSQGSISDMSVSITLDNMVVEN